MANQLQHCQRSGFSPELFRQMMTVEAEVEVDNMKKTKKKMTKSKKRKKQQLRKFCHMNSCLYSPACRTLLLLLLLASNFYCIYVQKLLKSKCGQQSQTTIDKLDHKITNQITKNMHIYSGLKTSTSRQIHLCCVAATK